MYQQQQRDPRAQFHPPPPPPLTPAQSHGSSYLPPPPPRPVPNIGHGHGHSHGQHLPPPPPGGPQPVSYWNRQQYQHPHHPPPPPPPSQAPLAPYNPGAYGAYSTAHTPVEPPPDQPLTSATYYPSGDSFGPGVGIPGYEQGGLRPNLMSGYSFDEHTRPRGRSDVATRDGERDREAREEAEAHPLVSRSPQPGASRDAEQQQQQQQSSTAAAAPPSPKDPGANWPLDTVLAWLSTHQFSDDWLRTFKKLNLHGSQFLDLGRGHNGRGNLSVLHSDIFPRLAKECTGSGTGWDQSREREESKRLRKLIRRVVDDETPFNVPRSARRSSFFTPHDQDSSTPSTAGGTGGESPDFRSPPLASAQTIAQRRLSTRGNKTSLPSISSPPELEPTKMPNSSQTHSPANSRDASSLTMAPRPDFSRSSHEQSPHPSPAPIDTRPQTSKPSPGPPSAAAARSIGHRRAASSSEFINQPTLHNGTAGAAAAGKPQGHDHRRNMTDTDRVPTVGEPARSAGSDHPPNSAKESRSFFNKFRRGGGSGGGIGDKTRDSSSPVSPVSALTLVFGNPKVNASEPSLAAPTEANRRPISPTTAPAMQRAASQQQPKRFVMVTPDGWNYRLLDVTDVDSADAFHDLVREKLGQYGTRDMHMFATTPGQTRHDEPLVGSALQRVLKTANSDGIVKLFIHSGSSSSSSTAPKQSPSDAEWTLVPEDARQLLELSVEEKDKAKSAAALDELERQERIKIEHQRHLQDVERKQQAYHKERQEQQANHRTINFDEPRASPREDKRAELVPKRPPPRAPPDPSVTMQKANSLKKRPQGSIKRGEPRPRSGEAMRQRGEAAAAHYAASSASQRHAPDSGIVGVLAGVGQMMAAPGRGTSAGGHSGGGRSDTEGSAEIKESSSTSTLMTATPPPPQQQRSTSALQAAANVGGNGTAPQAKSKSPGASPCSPGFTMSKGNVPFKIPSYSDSPSPVVARASSSAVSATNSATPSLGNLQARPAMPSRLPSNPNIEKIRHSRPGSSGSIDSSPTTTTPSQLSRQGTRGSRQGQKIDFTETHVVFDRAAEATPEVSDDDSDDNLFAVPLRGQSKNARSKRPSLRVQTPSTHPTTPGVTFGAAQDVKPAVSQPTSPRSDSRVGDGALPRPARSPGSPGLHESRTPVGHDDHRNSVFEIDDGWANRPQAEALIEDLDKFFPQVDLDQPIVDVKESPPPSPTLVRHHGRETKAPRVSSSDRGIGKAAEAESDHNESSGGDAVRALESVAQRNMRKSHGGGLSRAKSIREVVKSNYHHNAPGSTSGGVGGGGAGAGAGAPGLQRNPTVKYGSIVRRKSTKVNGAIATEIKPRHSRIGMLETIPQDSIAVAPRRQPTFKWMKGQLIGKGTFGRVYLGMNVGTGELLAVKQVEVNPNKAGQDKDRVREMVRALDQEIDTMQHLDHENIVQYLGCERKEYSISIFLEYISGGSVGSCLRKHGKFEETVVSSLTRQVLNGLAYLHHEGILHRDLKADNILLDMDGVCKISDFGISKKTDNIYGNDASNSMQGSVFWMAPEVVRSQGDGYSAKVDIWSLGCVVLEMFQGKRPFAGDELVGAIFKLGSLNQHPPIPEDVSKTISVAALSFMLDCWNIDPADRPTAETLLRAPFAFQNGDYNWYDTTLYAKIKMPPAGAEVRVGERRGGGGGGEDGGQGGGQGGQGDGNDADNGRESGGAVDNNDTGVVIVVP